MKHELIWKKLELWMKSNVQYLRVKVFSYWEKLYTSYAKLRSIIQYMNGDH